MLPGFPLDNKLSGNVVDLCPVGALGDKDFLYRQRVWFLRRHAGVCTGCATGCSILIEENQDRIYRLKPRENPQVNKWWICNEGRYGYPHVHDPQRLVDAAAQRQGDAVTCNVEWSELPARVGPSSCAAAGRLAAVLSPFLTVEEAYLLAKYVRRFDPQALVALGRCRAWARTSGSPAASRIRAEKCPNRRGVEAVVAQFTGELLTLGRVARADSRPRAVRRRVGSGGYRGATGSTTTAAALRRAVRCWSSGPVPLAALGAGDLRAARPRPSPSARLLRQPRRPVAVVPPGRSGRRRACCRREACTGSCWAAGAVQCPARAGRGCPRDRWIFPRRRAHPGGGRGPEGQAACGGLSTCCPVARRAASPTRQAEGCDKPIMVTLAIVHALVKIACSSAADDGRGVPGACSSGGSRPGSRTASGRTGWASR